ncbi:MAG: hypothetical protein ACL93V_17015 [Candidatus Electrothrix sp. YB6]
MQICPKCKEKTDTENSTACSSCGLVFAEYEQRKKAETGQVYQLIGAGKLQEAKELAEKLSLEFPESKGEFILLISNINRDINITEKYRQAKDLFNQGDYSGTVLLLRNIRAFDPGLEEKVISLRRKAERQNEDSGKFRQAVEFFQQEQYGAAKELFLAVRGERHQEEVAEYLHKLYAVRTELISGVIAALRENNLLFAQEKFNEVLTIFPDADGKYTAIATVLQQKKEISDRILEAAGTARKQGRLLEAKVMYSFLSWQHHELRPKLRPYLDEIDKNIVVSLADYDRKNHIDLTGTGLRIDENGFLLAAPSKQQSLDDNAPTGHDAHIAPVYICPEPLTDPPCLPVNIGGEEISDFT